MKLSLGLDFGTESVRALLVDLKGREHGVGIAKYRHGQITGSLPGSSAPLPPGINVTICGSLNDPCKSI